MCEIKSMIVLKNSVFCPLDYDSHTRMLEELQIEDNVDNPTIKFVRVELAPADGNIFNHDLDNWKLRTDQPYIPGWYNEFEAEERCKKELQKWFAERFILNDRSRETIQYGRFFVKDSSVVAEDNSYVVAGGNSYVVALDRSSVEAWDDTYVAAFERSSVIARDRSEVLAKEGSFVEAWDRSSVMADDHSCVRIPRSTEVKIKSITCAATVKDLSGEKPIIYVASTNFELKQFWGR